MQRLHGLLLSCSASGPSGLTEQTHRERDEEKNDENAEEDFRNAGRRTGDATKAEDAGDECDNEKDKSVVKHGNFSVFRCRKNVDGQTLFHMEQAHIEILTPTALNKNHAQSGTLSRVLRCLANTASNPLDPMTEHSKKAPFEDGLPGIAAFHPGVSAQLRDYYQSVQEEGIPERFLQLLERLDIAERQSGADTRVKDTAR